MRPRRCLAWLFSVAFATLLADCATAPGVATTQPALSASPIAPAIIARPPAPIDTLRWSIEGVTDLASLDPAKAGDSSTVTVVNFIFGGLVKLNERLEVVPNDAESWEASADGRLYTFTIRPNLQFANGDLVLAADYAYSINRAIQPETGSFGAPTQLADIVGAPDVIAGNADQASGIRALAGDKLQIELVNPSASFLQQLTFPYTFVVPRPLVESSTGLDTAPYGTGPYQVREWKRGESILLAANPHFWQGQPGVANIFVPFSANSATGYERYLAGELDIMGSLQNPLPAALLPAVRDTPDFRTSPALNTRYVGFNNRLPPFDSDDVRRAFALAVNKNAIAADLLKNEVVAADRILPPGMIGTSQAITPLAFDPTAAQAALAKAGYPEGQGLPPITFTYSPEGGENELVVKALQRDWQEHLGVAVALQSVDTNTLSSRLSETWDKPAQGLQLYYSVWGADYPDPQNFLSLQLQSSSRNNNGHFSDQRFDRLVAEADRISERTQIQRRLLLYNQAEQIAIDRVGWLPILHAKVHLLLHPRIQGIVVTPNGLVVPDWSKLRVG